MEADKAQDKPQEESLKNLEKANREFDLIFKNCYKSPAKPNDPLC